MPTAKDIHVAPISAQDANALVRRVHYSGKVVNNSQLHLGVFLNGRLEGAMQFGPSLDKRKIMGLVEGTGWNEFMELNRMAFSDRLPRNSESRALGVAFRMIRKHYPHLKWIISFADGTQCGDGTIYRASGFVLTGIKQNDQILEMPDGSRVIRMTVTKGKAILADGGAKVPEGAKALRGFQLRYIYFLEPSYRTRLTVPMLPFEEIKRRGASMYRGERPTSGGSPDSGTPAPTGRGGASPTPPLQPDPSTERHREGER